MKILNPVLTITPSLLYFLTRLFQRHYQSSQDGGREQAKHSGRGGSGRSGPGQPEGDGLVRERHTVQDQEPHRPQEADVHLLREGRPGLPECSLHLRRPEGQRLGHGPEPGHGGGGRHRGVPGAAGGQEVI